MQRALPHNKFEVLFGDTDMEFPTTKRLVAQIESFCQERDLAFFTAIFLIVSAASFSNRSRFFSTIAGMSTKRTTWTAPAKDGSESTETYRDEDYEQVIRQYFKKECLAIVYRRSIAPAGGIGCF